jgi:hypothetical protein
MTNQENIEAFQQALEDARARQQRLHRGDKHTANALAIEVVCQLPFEYVVRAGGVAGISHALEIMLQKVNEFELWSRLRVIIANIMQHEAQLSSYLADSTWTDYRPTQFHHFDPSGRAQVCSHLGRPSYQDVISEMGFGEAWCLRPRDGSPATATPCTQSSDEESHQQTDNDNGSGQNKRPAPTASGEHDPEEEPLRKKAKTEDAASITSASSTDTASPTADSFTAHSFNWLSREHQRLVLSLKQSYPRHLLGTFFPEAGTVQFGSSVGGKGT